MDFSDEDYRRLYVRRTVTTKRLGWEGRAVRNEMLTEFDRAGIWQCGDDPAADIAELVDMPIEVVRVGLERLLKTKTWVLGTGEIVWPSYVEAQTCGRSDRVRQQEARDRRRAEAIAKTAKLPSGVTDRHEPSRIVTPPSLPPSLPSAGLSGGRAHVGANPEPEPRSAPEHTEIRELRPSKRDQEPALTEPPMHTRIPESWTVTEEFYGEALLAGVSRAGLDECVTYWRGRKLGGEWFTPEDFFRGKFASIRKRREAESFRAAASHPARAGPRRYGSAQQDHGVDPFAFHGGKNPFRDDQ